MLLQRRTGRTRARLLARSTPPTRHSRLVLERLVGRSPSATTRRAARTRTLVTPPLVPSPSPRPPLLRTSSPGTVISSGVQHCGSVNLHRHGEPASVSHGSDCGLQRYRWRKRPELDRSGPTQRCFLHGGSCDGDGWCGWCIHQHRRPGVTALTYTDTTGAAGTTYSYEVIAVGASGTGGADGNLGSIRSGPGLRACRSVRSLGLRSSESWFHADTSWCHGERRHR